MLLLTNASGLLISCATPATNWPRRGQLLGLHELAFGLLQGLVRLARPDSISDLEPVFCSRSRSSALRRRVMSSIRLTW